jgi:hypothetical protein
LVAAYTVEPTAKAPKTVLFPRPSVVVRLVNVAPPSTETLRPPLVAAYTVEPNAKAPKTTLFPRPSVVVRFLNGVGSSTSVVVVVDVAGTVASGTTDSTVVGIADVAGTVASGTVGRTVKGLDCKTVDVVVSSGIAGFAKTFPSAIIGLDAVPPSVD